MNTKIHIDNESTICIVKNPVYHSKTKHIEIRHHFIRDCYEKKLISVEKIHTDLNVADLLTKPFDGPRFNYLVVSIGFAEILDFLRGSNLRYALTANPPIYDSLVKQFWQSAVASTREDGSLEISATVDTKKYIISEASIRDSLQLDDATGISMLPNDDLFEGQLKPSADPAHLSLYQATSSSQSEWRRFKKLEGTSEEEEENNAAEVNTGAARKGSKEKRKRSQMDEEDIKLKLGRAEEEAASEALAMNLITFKARLSDQFFVTEKIQQRRKGGHDLLLRKEQSSYMTQLLPKGSFLQNKGVAIIRDNKRKDADQEEEKKDASVMRSSRGRKSKKRNMEEYKDRLPEGYVTDAWGDLMFNVLHHGDTADFWDTQQDWKLISWKLHSSSGVTTIMTKKLDLFVLMALWKANILLTKEFVRQQLEEFEDSDDDDTVTSIHEDEERELTTGSDENRLKLYVLMYNIVKVADTRVKD
ncbi:hypothetical protein Tco_1428555 [Tanacetum coccineum]